MELDGPHHVTMITADARRNVEFYAGVLGLRLVKKTVNFDEPDTYHLYFGDERGSPGSILTWFEFPRAAPGRAGAGMIHLLELGVSSAESLGFWEDRLRSAGRAATLAGSSLSFEDPDGLTLALVPAAADNEPLRAEHPEIPPEHAITGVEAARAYAPAPPQDGLLTRTLGFRPEEGERSYELVGGRRKFRWSYDPAPEARGLLGSGSVHHIAWACPDEDQVRWRARLLEAGSAVTDVIDREYFTSIYFREPLGVLFEIATRSPGFAVDEVPEHLGEELRLPARVEAQRGSLEQILTPLENPRAARATGADA
jgi:glyoxalase family protein